MEIAMVDHKRRNGRSCCAENGCILVLASSSDGGVGKLERRRGGGMGEAGLGVSLAFERGKGLRWVGTTLKRYGYLKYFEYNIHQITKMT